MQVLSSLLAKDLKQKRSTSLKMGCVTWLEQHFRDRQLNTINFKQAIESAQQTLAPILQQYRALGWDVV
ncbi:hypothetical protein P4S72_11440 [Vibrio sp. PP-XX7]